MLKNKIKGLILAFFLFFAVLFGLFYFFEYLESNKRESKGKALKVSFEEINFGEPRLFPKYRQFAFPPMAVFRSWASYDHQLIFDVTYEFDRFGLRKLPLINQSKAQEHLLLGGCSFTFGQGVSLQETFPYLLENRHLDLNVYNFSFMGGGLHYHLRYMELMDLKDIVREEKGKFIYVFFSDHLARWFVTPSFLKWGAGYTAHYEVKNGQVVYKGEVENEVSYQMFRKAKAMGLDDTTLHLASIKNKNGRSAEELKEFALGVKELKKRYLKLFPKGEFHFLFHPSTELTDKEELILVDELKNHGIQSFRTRWVFQSLLKSRNEKAEIYSIPYDGHPNFKMNQFMATFIDRFILKRDGQNR